MSSKDDLISRRRQELLRRGYKPSIVDLAIDWAHGCAEGMAGYAFRVDNKHGPSMEDLTAQFLPQYLNDCEKYMRSFGHEPREA